MGAISYYFYFETGLYRNEKTCFRENPNSPAYNIYGKSNSDGRVPIGAAWIKTLKRGPNSGEEFLTITIDDPSLPRALNLAAFKNADTGLWDIMFRRRQEHAA